MVSSQGEAKAKNFTWTVEDIKDIERRESGIKDRAFVARLVVVTGGGVVLAPGAYRLLMNLLAWIAR
ncbi:MAG: hypothetical protein DMG25_01440 [Acidobacteria bacterium]|nr:MAG: hypothetical protein DMG25_01440 [Acidobacteriota bacterium]